MRIRTLSKNLAVSLLALVLSLSFFEIYLRLFSPQIMEHDRLFEPDPELGWRFKKSKRGGIVYSAAESHWVKTNEEGFRDEPFAGDTRPRKIFVLGDSFTSNINVRDSEVFTEVMEGLLPGTSVMNLGVNGYGQQQELLLFKKMLEKIKPELAVFVIYGGNDFEDNIQALPPYNEEPEPARLTNILHSAAWLETQIETLKAAKRLDRWRKQSWDPADTKIYEIQESPAQNKKFKRTEGLMLKIQALARKNGVETLFVYAPFIAQIGPYEWPDGLDPLRPQARLADFARIQGMAFLDLTPELKKEAEAGRPPYHESELHWNAAGNRLAAQVLAHRIGEKP